MITFVLDPLLEGMYLEGWPLIMNEKVEEEMQALIPETQIEENPILIKVARIASQLMES